MNTEQNWFALLTKSNFENVVNTRIQNKDIETFLPKIKTKSRQKNRRILVERPLFPGYLFVKSLSDPQAYLNILKTQGAVRLLGTKDNPVPIPLSQIESLKILTQSDNKIITGDSNKLKKGTPVIITNGPLVGVKGIFLKYKGKNRLIVDIDSLKQFAGIEVIKENVEIAPDIML